MNGKTALNKIGKWIGGRREASLVILLLISCLLIGVMSPDFFSSTNVDTIINDIAILAIVSIAQFFVILSNGIDISVGAIIAFSGMACGMINQDHPGTPIFVIILAGLGLGLAMGAINGALVAYGKIPPIITTLGTCSIFRGSTFLLSKNTWVTAHEMTDAFKHFPRGRFLGITTLVWCALIVIVIAYVFSRYTRTGRAIYAIGGNPTAAKFVGVSESKTRFIVFLISGLLSGFAGFLWTTRYASAVNEMASGFEMQAVASCVLGGVNFAGGSGGIIGVVLGALFFGIINNALPSLYLNVFWQLFVQGLIVLIALMVNTIVDDRKARKLLAQRRVSK
ncbi:MAG: ABC transporter permease [Sphaerochaetaceae bacterium]|nr:ABC transporter permease [Sphaerochaetaceae bacterium]MDD3163254.1 ABC transporter permease [Sphaerochaetaceae bacterium]MDD4007393.1 ABC transporter permease [Sphaerochaetaceae bacterium]MDD4396174.1 ABC transporter permease [Sphaerochaetaceae bacterium]